MVLLDSLGVLSAVRGPSYVLPYFELIVLIHVVIEILCTHRAYGCSFGFYFKLYTSVLSGLTRGPVRL